MLQYKHRYIYVFFIFVIGSVCGFFYDIKPMLESIDELRLTEEKLANKLQNIRRFEPLSHSKTYAKKASQSELLSDLILLARLNGLTLHSITQSDNAILHGMFQGGFPQLNAFLFALSKASFPVVIDKFHLNVINDFNCIFTMDMVIVNDFPFPKVEALRQSSNPFCVANRYIAQEKYEVAINSATLSQMKMIGFLQQKKRIQALLLLPNGALVTVKSGMVIGKEQGTVIAILHQYIHVKLPDNTHQQIKM